MAVFSFVCGRFSWSYERTWFTMEKGIQCTWSIDVDSPSCMHKTLFFWNVNVCKRIMPRRSFEVFFFVFVSLFVRFYSQIPMRPNRKLKLWLLQHRSIFFTCHTHARTHTVISYRKFVMYSSSVMCASRKNRIHIIIIHCVYKRKINKLNQCYSYRKCLAVCVCARGASNAHHFAFNVHLHGLLAHGQCWEIHNDVVHFHLCLNNSDRATNLLEFTMINYVQMIWLFEMIFYSDWLHNIIYFCIDH